MRIIRLLALAGLSVLLQAAFVFGHEGVHELIEAQKKKVEKAPADPVLRFELANLLSQHGDAKSALETLDRVDALAPGKFLTDFLRGQIWLGAGEFAKAKEALDRQLVSHPGNAPTLLWRARAEQKLGQDQPSLADYREALKRTPSPEPDLIQEVAEALATHGYEKEAAQVLTAGIEKLGKIPALVLRALELEIKDKDFDAAFRRIDDAQKNAPRPEPWMARRATVLAQAGRIDESRAAWQALEKHLASLPERERRSTAMTNLAEETSKALALLGSKAKP